MMPEASQDKSYEEYLARYHGHRPLTREQWERIQPTVTSSATPTSFSWSCTAAEPGCYISNMCWIWERCLHQQHSREPERLVPRAVPEFTPRLVVSDDSQQIRLGVYDLVLSPKRALQLAADLLAAGLRGLERGAKL